MQVRVLPGVRTDPVRTATREGGARRRATSLENWARFTPEGSTPSPSAQSFPPVRGFESLRGYAGERADVGESGLAVTQSHPCSGGSNPSARTHHGHPHPRSSVERARRSERRGRRFEPARGYLLTPPRVRPRPHARGVKGSVCKTDVGRFDSDCGLCSCCPLWTSTASTPAGGPVGVASSVRWSQD